MNILNIAIKEEGSATRLADSLGVVPSAIGNWKSRGIPKAWQLALALKYKKAIKKNEFALDSQNVKVELSTVVDETT